MVVAIVLLPCWSCVTAVSHRLHFSLQVLSNEWAPRWTIQLRVWLLAKFWKFLPKFVLIHWTRGVGRCQFSCLSIDWNRWVYSKEDVIIHKNARNGGKNNSSAVPNRRAICHGQRRLASQTSETTTASGEKPKIKCLFGESENPRMLLFFLVIGDLMNCWLPARQCSIS